MRCNQIQSNPPGPKSKRGVVTLFSSGTKICFIYDCVANWNHAKDSEGITSLGEKPLEEEEASVESFEDIYVDKHNKEDFQTDT